MSNKKQKSDLSILNDVIDKTNKINPYVSVQDIVTPTDNPHYERISKDIFVRYKGVVIHFYTAPFAQKHQYFNIRISRDHSYKGKEIDSITEALDIFLDYLKEDHLYYQISEGYKFFDQLGNQDKLEPEIDVLDPQFIKCITINGLSLKKEDIVKIGASFKNLRIFDTENCFFEENASLFYIGNLYSYSDIGSSFSNFNILNNTNFEHIRLSESKILNPQSKVLKLNTKELTLDQVDLDYSTFFLMTEANSLTKLEILNSKPLTNLTFLPCFVNLEEISINAVVDDMSFLRRMRRINLIAGIKFNLKDGDAYLDLIHDNYEDILTRYQGYGEYVIKSWIDSLVARLETRLKKFYNEISISTLAEQEYLAKSKTSTDKEIADELKTVDRMFTTERKELGKEGARERIITKQRIYKELGIISTLKKAIAEAKKCPWVRQTKPILNSLGIEYFIPDDNPFAIFGSDGRVLPRSHSNSSGNSYDNEFGEDEFENDNTKSFEDAFRELLSKEPYIPNIVRIIGSYNMKLSFAYHRHSEDLKSEAYRDDIMKRIEKVVPHYDILMGEYSSALCMFGMEEEQDPEETAKQIVIEQFHMSKREAIAFRAMLTVMEKLDDNKHNILKNHFADRLKMIRDNYGRIKSFTKEDYQKIRKLIPKIYESYQILNKYFYFIYADMIEYYITGKLPPWVQNIYDNTNYPEWVEKYDNSGNDLVGVGPYYNLGDRSYQIVNKAQLRDIYKTSMF